MDRCLGAGSVFEGLQAKKLLLVVPNARLMHNHQIELAHRLERMGHLVTCPNNRWNKTAGLVTDDSDTSESASEAVLGHDIQARSLRPRRSFENDAKNRRTLSQEHVAFMMGSSISQSS